MDSRLYNQFLYFPIQDHMNAQCVAFGAVLTVVFIFMLVIGLFSIYFISRLYVSINAVLVMPNDGRISSSSGFRVAMSISDDEGEPEGIGIS